MQNSDSRLSIAIWATIIICVCAGIYAMNALDIDWGKGIGGLFRIAIPLLVIWSIQSNRRDRVVDSSRSTGPYARSLPARSTTRTSPSMPISRIRPEKDPMWDRWLDG